MGSKCLNYALQNLCPLGHGWNSLGTSITISWGEQELLGAVIGGSEDMPIHSERTRVSAALVFQALKEIRIEVKQREPYPEEGMAFMSKCLRRRLDLGMGLKVSFLIPKGTEGLRSQLNSALKDVEGTEVHESRV